MKIFSPCAACLLFLCATFLHAGDVVSRRTFVQESNFQFDVAILEQTVQTRKGVPYSETMVDDDVKRLAARNEFADVRAAVKKLADGSIEVEFHLIANPLVERVTFIGNKKIPTDKLKAELRFPLHAPQNDAKLIDTAERIRAMYQAAGRGGTTVRTEIKTLPGDTREIVFRIDEELRVRVNDVVIEGCTVYSASELRDVMETRYSPFSVSWLSFLPFEGNPGLYSQEALARDRVRLHELYLRKGYLDFKVKDIKIAELPDDPEMVNVIITVEEGEPYYVGAIKVTGVTGATEDGKEKRLEKVRACIHQTPDNVYNAQTEDRDLDRIGALYSPEGYADFNASVVKNPNYKTHTVDLEYKIYEGPQYTVGEIFINASGAKLRTKPHVILRELPIKPDDKVDKRKLDIAKSRLLGMNYFGDETGRTGGVEVTTRNSEEPGKKDIYLDLNEKQFLDGRIGFGWSDTDGLAGSIDAWHSNADLLDPANYFTGGGQRINLHGLVGIERMDAVLDFTEPWLFGIPLRWDFSTYWRDYEYDDWKEMRLGFTTSLTKRVFDDFTSVKLGYTFEQVRIHKMEKKLGPIFQDQKGRDLVGRIFLNLERDTRDSFTDPRSGYDVALYASLTTKALGATNNYYRVELKGVNYLPFFHDWFVLMTGFKIGAMDAFGGDTFVPLYDRYFLGGGDSIRGFPYRSIGPTDDREDNYGGEFMYVASVELTHPIYKDYLRGAIFCDIGDATRRAFKFEAPNVGIGYGLRIKLPNVPVPIRLDLAYPVVNNQEGVKSRLRFHFQMGFSFF